MVVLIMGILASVAMPQYFKSVEKSRSAEAVNALSAIVDAQERAYMQAGSYVTKVGLLKDLDIGVSNFSYFTVMSIMALNTATSAYYARMGRTESAGGGLGSYVIYLYYPQVPGTGARTWDCTPTSAGCKSFLPQ